MHVIRVYDAYKQDISDAEVDAAVASGPFDEECGKVLLAAVEALADCLRKMSPDAIAWSSEKWTPEAVDLREGERTYPTNDTEGYKDAKLLKGEWWDHIYAKYKPNREDITKFRKVLHDGYMTSNSVGRFTGAMYPHYDGVAPHGFSVWGKGDLGDAMNFRGDCYENGGLHWMTLDAAKYSKGSGSNWHPPAGMHLLRGEILAYNYVHVMLDAIDMVETALKQLGNGNDTPAKRKEMVDGYLKKLQKLQKPMPEKPMFCSPDCDTKPLCYTNFEPHYNNARRLTNLVVGEHEGRDERGGQRRGQGHRLCVGCARA